MSQFRTEVTPNTLPQKLSYDDTIFLIGSCFSENIGKKFDYYKFNVLTNPFGVLFNPISISKIIQRTIKNQLFTENDFQYHQGKWFCFETHGSLTAKTKEECILKHNKALLNASSVLETSTFIIITLGSAWVYKHNKTDEIVANCHKIPNHEFSKTLLSINEIVNSLNQLIEFIKVKNPAIKIILTISPVRHLKDGFVENQKSKSVLNLAAHQLIDECKNVFYFPAYEILMDDLRDYRFYKEDMLHPNEQAISYIWEKFKFSSIKDSCLGLMKRIEKVQTGLNHRPFDEDSKEYKTFKRNLEKEIDELKKLGVNF